MKKLQSLVIMLLGFVLFSGCKKDPVVDPNENELITTVRISLLDKTGGSTTPLVFEFKDLDGEGGAAPSKFDEIVLTKGKTYDCSLMVLNESVSPADDITKEILAEAVDHQFYYSASDGLVTVSNLNNDSKGLPVGTTATWTTGTLTGSGTFRITLKHKPGVKAAGDLVTVGETDIALDFKLKVQ
ncbi:MAG: hypothetical protein RJB03_968 [Bacteroidota bacterium]|jgi:hypothetical protein